jgi:uncharacterized protein (TIGR02328 family)
MRLWHQELIPHLPRQQLLGQHRECCALRGAGWGRKHSVVNYVFKYSPSLLVAYHKLIMNEMKNRGYNPDPVWDNINWRGTRLGEESGWANDDKVSNYLFEVRDNNFIIYPEHNDVYLQECIENLKSKGIEVNVNT